MTDLNIAKKLLPKVEKSIVDELNDLLNNAKVIEIMNASRRKTLFRKDLGISDRFLELGKIRTFAESELKTLIKKNIGIEKNIQGGVIKMIRGYLVENLNEKIIKIQKLVMHSPNNKTMKAEHWDVYYR